MRGKFIAGLDIGTTKVCAVVAASKGRGAELAGMGIAPSLGLKKGVVVDMDAATASVRDAVKSAEQASGVRINAVYIGVAGGQIECRRSFGATGIKGSEITKKDIERVIESASSVYVPLDREVLHVFPTGFSVDGQGGIVQPIGMSGTRLEVEVSVVTAAHSTVQNLVRCCTRAGLTVIETVLEPIATAGAVLLDDERAEGVVLVDMGGGTTDIALYKDGMLRLTAVIPVGGNNFTNDIAIGMKVAQREAERLKKQFGYAAPEPGCAVEMEVIGMDGQKKTMPVTCIADIIRPRAEETIWLIRDAIAEEGLSERPACIVLTGGGALLKGLDRMAEAMLGLTARQGVPTDLPMLNLGGLKGNQAHATGIGLVLYGAQREWSVYDDLWDGVLGRLAALKRGLFDAGGLSRLRPGRLGT